VYLIAALCVLLFCLAGVLIVGVMRDPDFFAKCRQRLSDSIGRAKQNRVRRAAAARQMKQREKTEERERLKQVILQEKADKELTHQRQRELYLALHLQLRDQSCQAILQSLVAVGSRITTLFQANAFPFATEPLVIQLADISVACSGVRESPEFVEMAMRIHSDFLEVCKLVRAYPFKQQQIIGGGFGIGGAAKGIAMAGVANWLLNSGVGGKQESVMRQIGWNLERAHQGIQFLAAIQNAEQHSERLDS
jgi:hypothetical protein